MSACWSVHSKASWHGNVLYMSLPSSYQPLSFEENFVFACTHTCACVCPHVYLKTRNGNEKSLPLYACPREPALRRGDHGWRGCCQDTASWSSSWPAASVYKQQPYSALLMPYLWSALPGKCLQSVAWFPAWNDNPRRWQAVLNALLRRIPQVNIPMEKWYFPRFTYWI